MAGTLQNIYNNFRQMASSKRETGKLFEKFVREYLRLSPIYGKKWKNVVLWNDWEYAHGNDVGIDLIAERIEDGGFVAIQCKFYEGSTVPKAGVDSFLATAGREFFGSEGKKVVFSELVLFSTTELGLNAQNALKDRPIPVHVRYLDQLPDEDDIDWNVFWAEFDEKFVSSDTRTHISNAPIRNAKKKLLDHQKDALQAVEEGFKTHDRGSLVMACGTGKTLTSLRIAEKITPERGHVLYLVPSLSLLAQTLSEWTIQSNRKIAPVIVCSDAEIHERDSRRQEAMKKSRSKTLFSEEDQSTFSAVELTEPATTRPDLFAQRVQTKEKNVLANDPNAFVVVFSTYQSIQTIIDAQANFDASEFDLTVCDEAHRTTGVSLSKSDETAFTKVHDANLLKSVKRLYMTATPKIYGDAVKSKVRATESQEGVAVICSMDDEAIYGPTFYKLGFRKAVDLNLLSDYRVVILVVDKNDARRDWEKYRERRLARGDNSDFGSCPLDVEKFDDDFAKLIGVWRGLSKTGEYLLDNGTRKNDFESDPAPMKRAVAYCDKISNSKGFAEKYDDLWEALVESERERGVENPVRIEISHIDGSMSSEPRQKKLTWLKSEVDEEDGTRVCRILSNVRCLSEGVDCPTLDAILFMTPRTSKIDIIQSIGRVMRKAPGKKYGYVVIPIVVPSEVEVEDALDDNENFRVVWQVLQGLRSHDERLRVKINQLKLASKTGEVPPESPIDVFGAKSSGLGQNQDDVEIISPNTPKRPDSYNNRSLLDELTDDAKLTEHGKKIAGAICAKVAKRCGDSQYLEHWAEDVAKIAQSYFARFREALENPTPEQSQSFEFFYDSLKRAINPNLTREEALDALTQHFVSRPIFDALFKDSAFIKKNVVAKTFQLVLDAFANGLSKEDREALDELEKDVRYQIEGIQTKKSRHEVLKNFYDKFFKIAAPKVSERLGIVYTPQEVVDYILRSVDYVVKTEFKKPNGLSTLGVDILDPFTGTGTFISRLLELNLMREDEIKQQTFVKKFKNELHANEIVPLAYYVAAANIETIFEEQTGVYKPFPGIVLTDTFALETGRNTEQNNLFTVTGEINDVTQLSEIDEAASASNTERLEKLRRTSVEVIIGNPPYSAKQGSSNDNNQNRKYEILDRRIAETYVAKSKANLKNSLYDTYVKAIRWASDRISQESGVIGFVSNGAFIDNAAFDGFRQLLIEEFASIYVFNLRGDQRTSGEKSRQEGGKIFGSGSRAPIAITILVKNANREKDGFIRYFAIDDYKTREQKLEKIEQCGSIANTPWNKIMPDVNGDWINLRDSKFDSMPVLGEKKKSSENAKECSNLTFFEPVYSMGISTSRDAWCYNFSRNHLITNMKKTIDFYNQQSRDYAITNGEISIEDFVDNDPTKISWSDGLRNNCKKGNLHTTNIEDVIRIAVYRPFTKCFVVFDKIFIERTLQVPKLFPSTGTKNLAISVLGIGAKKDEFSPIMVDEIPDVNLQEAGTQCFPLYYYVSKSETNLFTGNEKIVEGYVRRDAITDNIWNKAKNLYEDDVTKKDIFYFVYGALHAKDYRKRFANDLKKSLPRLDLPKSKSVFLRFSEAGRELANLHLNYDGENTIVTNRAGKKYEPPKLYEFIEIQSSLEGAERNCVKVEFSPKAPIENPKRLWHITKLEWGKRLETEAEFKERCERKGLDPQAENKRKIADKTTLIYNSFIKITGIPLKADNWKVNGRSPIEWIIDRYKIAPDKKSGIVNDPNDWCENPRYVIDLILRLITVSLQTQQIVDCLPNLLED